MRFCEKIGPKTHISRYAVCKEACAQLDLKYSDDNIDSLYPKMIMKEAFLNYYNTLRDNNQPISHELRAIAERYAQQDVEFTKIVERRINEMKNKHRMPQIKNVIFNDPATIVLWEDGTKTVVKCGDYDIYDPEKGLAMAIAKKTLGNQGSYYETFKKWLPEEGEWDTTQPFIDEKSRLDVETAYKMLVEVARNKKATKADLAMAIGDAIGYLGEVLAE